MSSYFNWIFFVLDGGIRASQLDREATSASADQRDGLATTTTGCSGVSGGQKAGFVWDPAVLEQQVRTVFIEP